MSRSWLKSSGGALILTALAVVGLMTIIYSVSLGGWKALSVQTGSMRPAIEPGDLVLVKNVPASSVKVGDILTYINPEDNKSTITHRVTAITGVGDAPRTFIVKGDANAKADSPVPQTRVVGIAEHQIPYAGRIVDFTRNPIGLILIIYIPALAIIISEIRRLAAYYKSQQPYILYGYAQSLTKKGSSRYMSKVAAGLILVATCMAYPASSALAIPEVKAELIGSTIASVPRPTAPPTSDCSVTNNNSTSVTNNSSQSASSGNVQSNNNTSDQSATSGNASNSNTTNITIVNNSQNQCSL